MMQTSSRRTLLARAESLCADLRSIRDRIDVSLETGLTGRNDATPFAPLVLGHNALREDLAKSLAAVDSTPLRGDDARALGIMRRSLARELGAVSAPAGSPGAAAEPEPACDYDPGAEVHGPFVVGDSTWYSWVATRLYRFGLERPTRQVIEDFLGGR